MPEKYMDTWSMSGSMVLVLIAASQAFGVIARLGRVDYLDHLIGMVIGFVSARWWRNDRQKKDEYDISIKLGSWWETLLGKGR